MLVTLSLVISLVVVGPESFALAAARLPRVSEPSRTEIADARRAAREHADSLLRAATVDGDDAGDDPLPADPTPDGPLTTTITDPSLRRDPVMAADFSEDTAAPVAADALAVEVAEGFVEDESVVIDGSPTTLTYANPDGSETKQVFAEPAAFEEVDGTWTQFDATLVDVGDRAEVAAVQGEISFADSSADPAIMELTTDKGSTVGFSLVGAADAPAIVDDGSVLYEDVFQGTDLVEQGVYGGVKEVFVVNVLPSSAPVYRFDLDLDGLSARTRNDRIELVDRQGFVAYVIPQGIAWDSNSSIVEEARQVPVTTRLVRSGTGWAVEVEPSYVWMSDPARVFPLMIDPTVRMPVNSAGAFDGYVVDTVPYGYYDTGIDRIGYSRVGSSWNAYATYMRFGDIDLPDGAVFVNATVTLAVAYTAKFNSSGGIYSPADGPMSAALVNAPYTNPSNPNDHTKNYVNRPTIDWSTVTDVWAAQGAGTTFEVNTWAYRWLTEGNFGMALWGGPNGSDFYGQPGARPFVEIASFENGFAPYLSLTYSTRPTNLYPDYRALVHVSSSANQLFSWDDPDDLPTSYAVVACDNVTGTPCQTFRNAVTTNGQTRSMHADIRSLLNSMSTNYVEWHVEKTVEGGGPTITSVTVGTQIWFNAPTGTSPSGSIHPPSNGDVDFGWLDFEASNGVRATFVVEVCQNADFSACVTSGAVGSQAGTATYGSTVPTSSLPVGRQLFWRVRKTLLGAATYSNTGTFTIRNTQPPAPVLGVTGTDGYVRTNAPELSFAPVVDPDGDLVQYKFVVCDQPRNLGNCVTSGYHPVGSGGVSLVNGSVTWSTARNWATTYYWSVVVKDGYATSTTSLNASQDSVYFAPDNSLSALWSVGNYPNGAPSGNVETSNGNLHFVDRDVDPATVGIDIGIDRSYNSLDPRIGSFGRGWTTPLEMSVLLDAGGSAVVLMPDGRREFHGKNPDGKFARAFGYENDFVFDAPSGEYRLTDAAKTIFRFKDSNGSPTTLELIGITDADANSVTISSPTVVQTIITDVASGRSMTLNWATPVGSTRLHVTSVVAGGSTWTYTYSVDALTEACLPDLDPGPGVRTPCTQYVYDENNRMSEVLSPQDKTGSAWAPNVVNVAKVLWQAEYDTTGRVTVQRNGVSNDTTPASQWTYAYATNVTYPTPQGTTVLGRFRTIVTDPLGGQRIYVFDATRRLVYSHDEVDGEEWHEYNTSGFRTRSTTRVAPGAAAESFATTEFTVNALGQNIRRVDPNGSMWQWTYNAVGQVRSEINPFGLITSYTYDNNDQGSHAMTKSQSKEITWQPPYRWSMDETSGGNAANSGLAGSGAGTYSSGGITLGAPGAPDMGSTNRSVSLSGGSARVPSAAFRGTNKSYALWFRTSTAGGVLLSKNSATAGGGSFGHNPFLYVGTDGKLYARLWNGGGDSPIVTPAAVNDGSWHRVILTDSGSTQTLYLDGNTIGSYTGAATDDTSWPYSEAYVGTGESSGWPATTGGWMPFIGDIDDVTVYNGVLGPAEIRTTVAYSYTNASTPTVDGEGNAHPPAWLMASTTDQAGRITRFEYDRGGDLRRSTDAAGVITEYTYTALGLPLIERRSVDDGASWVQMAVKAYDAAGRLVQVDGPPTTNTVTGEVHRQRTSNVYDDAGLLLSVTESDIGASAHPDAPRTTTYHYDNAGRRDRVTDATGAFTDTEYDAAGRPIRTTDARGTSTIVGVDAVGRETSVTIRGFVADPIGAPTVKRDVTTSRKVYDPAGRLIRDTDAGGRVKVTTYSNMGQPVRVDLYRSESERLAGTIWKVLTTTAYDLVGNPVQVASFGHDEGGPRMVQVADSVYDRQGRLASTTVRNGAFNGGNGSAAGGTGDETTSYTYDLLGNITRTVRSGGVNTSITDAVFDVHNLPSTLTMENGAVDIVSTTVRDRLGNTASQTDAAGQTGTFTYDALGRVVMTTLPPVSVTTVDRLTGVATTTANQRPEQSVGYNTFGEVTHNKDANGMITVTSRDVVGRPTLITYPTYVGPATGVSVTPTEQTWYDTNGNVIRHRDRAGSETTFDFDMRNRSVRRTDPAASVGATAGVTRTYYDDMSNVVAVVNPVGSRIERSYDGLDRLVTSTEYVTVGGTLQALTSTFTLDDAGRAITTCAPAPAGQTRCASATYSPMGQVLTSTDPSLAVTRFGYDGLGRQTMTVDPLGRRAVTSYDLAGRAVSSTTFGSDGTALASTTSTLNGVGEPIEILTPESGRQANTYDSAGRLSSTTVTTTATDSITASYEYDRAGNHTSTVDGRGNRWLFTYNPWGLMQDTFEPATIAYANLLDRRYTSQYDAAGRAVRDDLPGGVVINKTFDRLGRQLTQVSAATPTSAGASSAWTYDLAGRVVSLTAPGGLVQTSYNERGQPLVVTSVGGSSTFDYDVAGRTTKRTDVFGGGSYVSQFAWDASDRLAGVVDPLTNQARTLHWNPDGRVGSVEYGTAPSAARTYTYDAFGRLSIDVLKGADGATVLRSATYGYDTASRLRTETIAGVGVAGAGTNQYGYDSAGRLTSWISPTAVSTAYGYDKSGNRVVAGGATSTFDQRNRLTATTGSTPETLTWTARGTLASRTASTGVTNYTFDGFGRMTKAGEISYQYDALGRAALRSTAAVWSRLQYPGLDAKPMSDGTNTIARTPGGAPIAMKTAYTPARTVAQDRHGDVVALFAAGGSTLSDSMDYTPFGEVAGRTGTTPSNIGFQGDWTDPVTKLVGMGARWYSPSWGQFVSRDSYAGNLGSPVSLNRYTYANNDPMGGYDPDGHACRRVDGAYQCSGGQPRADPTEHRALSAHTKPVGRTTPKSVAKSSGTYASSRQQYVSAVASADVAAVDAISRYVGMKREDYDPTKDPHLKKLAHSVVQANYTKFDISADGKGADGFVGKRDFEAVRDGSGKVGQDKLMQWAAGMLLADDKKVDQKKADPEHLEDYGWKLYKKKDKGFWEGVTDFAKSIAPTLAGLIVGIGCMAALGVSTGGAGLAAAGTCAVAGGAVKRGLETADKGGSIMDAAYAASDPKSVAVDFLAGAATQGVANKLTKVGSAAASSTAEAATNTGGARFVAGSDGAVTDLVGGSPNAVVLGKYPAYVNEGAATGARTFSMSDEAWNAMAPAQQWTRNQQFLDQAISRGSEIRLATPPTASNLTGWYAREIEYLTKQGYTISSNGARMIPPGG